MSVDSGMRFGGTLLASPASLPGGDAFLLVSSTGIGSTAPLATYQAAAAKGQADGYASLDSGGKLPAAQLPAIAITEYLGEAADQAAMLLLDGQQGDWTVRTDTGTVWIITGSDPSDVGDWQELSYPTAPVQSVAGKTGVVTLAAGDIVSGTFADARISENSVTQHEAALAITESQISDLGSYLTTADIASGTITPVAGDLTFTGGSEGDVLTQQADGSFAPETPSGGGISSPYVLTSGGTSEVPFTVDGASGQTANLQQWRNSGGTVQAYVSSTGNISAAGDTVRLLSDAGYAAIYGHGGRRILFNSSTFLLWSGFEFRWTLNTSDVSIVTTKTTLKLIAGTTADAIYADNNATAGNTRALLYDVDSGALQRVKVGSNGTGPGGTGRALYIDNL